MKNGLFVEPVGNSVPDGMLQGLTRGFTESERKQVFEVSRLLLADAGHSTPKALFVCGPSGVGKSSITARAVRELMGSEMNAVLIDGALFREYHGGWTCVRADGLQRDPPAIHKEAWDTFKRTKVSERLKNDMFEKALGNRQHLVIPDCATNIEKVRKRIVTLREAGYEVHLIALYAPEDLVTERGVARSVKEGKAFSTRGYQDSLRNTLQLLHEAGQLGVPYTMYDNSAELEEVTLAEYEMMCAESVPSPSSQSGFLRRYDSISTVTTVPDSFLRRGESIASMLASSDEQCSLLDCTLSSLSGLSHIQLPQDTSSALAASTSVGGS